MSTRRLSRTVLAAYAAPTFAEQIMLGPVFDILPTLYAQHTRATLKVIGVVFMSARVFDAVYDPVVGYLSDSTRSRYGPRKPWILAGALSCALSVLFFYQPSANAGGLYFFTWCLALFLGWTMLVIPYNAWAVELTGDYQERARLFGWRNALGGLGGLAFTLSPVILRTWTGNTQFTFQVLRIVSWTLAVLLPLSAAIALAVVPRGHDIAIDRPSLRGLFGALRRNRVMWLFMSICLFGGLGQGLFTSLWFLFTSTYLGLGSYVSLFGTVQFVVYVASIPLWVAAVGRFGKHKPWAIANFLLAATAPVMTLLPRGHAALAPMVAISVLSGLFGATNAVSPQSMLADVIDYDTLKTGVNRAGNYFAFLTFLSKVTTGVGGGLGLMLVGLFGYTPGVPNTPAAQAGFLTVLALGPAILGGFNGLLIFRYPLDRRRQTIIRKRIERRGTLAERTVALAVSEECK
jgi:glycoside/pentoside/hexuronide:cation symporter, GPH family